MRPAMLAASALTLALAACGTAEDPNMYCYKQLGQPVCYDAPVERDAARLLGVFPKPKKPEFED